MRGVGVRHEQIRKFCRRSNQFGCQVLGKIPKFQQMIVAGFTPPKARAKASKPKPGAGQPRHSRRAARSLQHRPHVLHRHRTHGADFHLGRGLQGMSIDDFKGQPQLAVALARQTLAQSL
jgi:hypothetical protein